MEIIQKQYFGIWENETKNIIYVNAYTLLVNSQRLKITFFFGRMSQNSQIFITHSKACTLPITGFKMHNKRIQIDLLPGFAGLVMKSANESHSIKLFLSRESY